MGRLHLSIYIHLWWNPKAVSYSQTAVGPAALTSAQHTLKMTGWQAEWSPKHLSSVVHAPVINQLRKSSSRHNLKCFSWWCMCMCWLFSLLKFSTKCALKHVCHPSHCWSQFIFCYYHFSFFFIRVEKMFCILTAQGISNAALWAWSACCTCSYFSQVTTVLHLKDNPSPADDWSWRLWSSFKWGFVFFKRACMCGHFSYPTAAQMKQFRKLIPLIEFNKNNASQNDRNTVKQEKERQQ